MIPMSQGGTGRKPLLNIQMTFLETQRACGFEILLNFRFLQ